MIERDAFLAALAANEDDTTTRLVYADWLDEQGEHEEADRQRKWPAAKEWLVRFCAANNRYAPDDDEVWYISYETLLELGLDAVARADETADETLYGFSCGNNETVCNALRRNAYAFWENWSVVTGIALPLNQEHNGSFGCGC